jgi:hypothetical protein
MLLNLSNHPSKNWSPEQTALAIRQFGTIEDLPFPHISPLLDTEGVVVLAQKYGADILAMQKSDLTVHLMGELSFCFALTKLLQRQGITVVCSTTDRTVLEEKDGKKTTKFHFQQFRPYPS